MLTGGREDGDFCVSRDSFVSICQILKLKFFRDLLNFSNAILFLFFFFLLTIEYQNGNTVLAFIIRSFISSYIRVNQDFRDMKIFIASFFSILIARTF